MAVVITVVADGVANTIWNVISNDAADTTGTITHNLAINGVTTVAVILLPLLDVGISSRWFVSALTANTVVLTKTAGAGSINAAAQLRVFVQPFNFAKLVP